MDITFFTIVAGMFMLSLAISYTITALSSNMIRDALRRDITQQTTLILSSLISLVLKPFLSLYRISANAITSLATNTKWAVLFIILTVLALCFHLYQEELLQSMDESWRCAVQPGWKNIFVPVTQIARAVYGTIIPIVNLVQLITSQLIKGTGIVIFKCQMANFIAPIVELFKGIGAFTTALFGFLGGNAPISSTNNIVVNSFSIEKSLNHTMAAFRNLEPGLQCACKGLSPVIGIAFTPAHSHNVTLAIDHTWQAGIAALQVGLRALPPSTEFPNIFRVTTHLEKALVFLGLGADDVFFDIMHKVVTLFVPEFPPITHRPTEAIFATAGRAAAGTVQLAASFFNGPIQLFGALVKSGDTGEMESWMIDKPMSQFHIFTYDVANNVHWLLGIAEYAAKGALGLDKDQPSNNTFSLFSNPNSVATELSCDWVTDESEGIRKPPSHNTGCQILYFGSAVLHTTHTVYNMILEIFFKSIFSQDQNVFRTLQRFEGPWYPRNQLVTCKTRKEMGNIWDFTVNPDRCQCDMFLGQPLQPSYEPACGQPSFQLAFADLDAVISHRAMDVVGPQLAVVAASPFKAFIEIIRLIMRFTLSTGDIFGNHYFQYEINCGYGLNSTQLIRRYRTLYPETVWIADKSISLRPGEQYLPLDDASLRYGPCQDRAYTPNLQMCKHNNDNSDCMCNYDLSISTSSRCRCTNQFPRNLYSAAASEQEQDRILYRITDSVMTQHWCNSMFYEWFIYYQTRMGDGLDYALSGGPLNPQCDMVDRLFSGELFDEPIVQTSSVQTFSGKGEVVEAKPTNNYAIATTSTPIKELESGARPAQCTVWGRLDLFCSAGLVARQLMQTFIGIERQLMADIVAVLMGDFKQVDVDLMPRVCDAEKVLGGLSSAVGSIIPFISTDMQKAITKMTYTGFNAALVVVPRVLVSITNGLVQLIELVVEGRATGDDVVAVIKTLLDEVVSSYMSVLIDVSDSFAKLFDAISSGAGDIFVTIRDIFKVLNKSLADGLLDYITSVAKLLFDFLALVTGNGDVAQFGNSLVEYVMSVVELLATILTSFGRILLTILGPIGEGIKLIISSVCPAIQGAFNFINKIEIFGNRPFQIGTIQCPKLSHGHHHSRLLAHHETLENLPELVAQYDWNGSSTCDLFVEAIRFEKYTDLRPLEKITLIECLDQRSIGARLADSLGLHHLPHDIFYNWKRKYSIASDTLQATLLALQLHFSTNGEYSRQQLRQAFDDAHLHTDLMFEMIDKAKFISSTAWQRTSFADSVEFVMKHMDKHYNDARNPSMTAETYRAFKITSRGVQQSREIWTKNNGRKQVWKAVDALADAHTRVRSWWAQRPVLTNYTKAPSFHAVLRSVHHNFKEHIRQRPPPKEYRRARLWLGVPVKSDVRECSEKDQTFCLECAIFDNLMETSLESSRALALWYSGDYVIMMQDINNYFSDLVVDNKQWMEDVFNKLARRHRLHTRHVPDVSWTYSVQKDWEYLFYDLISWNASRQTAGLHNFSRGLQNVLTTVNASHVEYFGYGLPYALTYPIAEGCDVESVIYKPHTSEQQRVVYIDHALIACGILSLVFIFNSTWSVFPCTWLTNISILMAINSFVFLYIVYGYLPNCAPLLPNFLVEDLHNWAVTRMTPGCFCESFSNITTQCLQDTCNRCAATIEYAKCSDNVPIIGELSIFWNVYFWLFWRAPWALGLLAQWDLVSPESAIGEMAYDALQGSSVNPVIIDCFHATILNVPVSLGVGGFAIYVVFQMLAILAQLIIDILLFFWNLFLLLQYMSIGLEQSIRKSEE